MNSFPEKGSSRNVAKLLALDHRVSTEVTHGLPRYTCAHGLPGLPRCWVTFLVTAGNCRGQQDQMSAAAGGTLSCSVTSKATVSSSHTGISLAWEARAPPDCRPLLLLLTPAGHPEALYCVQTALRGHQLGPAE